MDRGGTSLDDGVRDEGDKKVRGKCLWVSGVNVQTGGIGMTLSLLDEREEDFYFFFLSVIKLFCISQITYRTLWTVWCYVSLECVIRCVLSYVYIGITPWGNAL